jgi:hypothetical protein
MASRGCCRVAFERLDEAFILRHAHLSSWCCIKFGFDRKYLGVGAVAEIAGRSLSVTQSNEALLAAFDLSKLEAPDYEKAAELLDALFEDERHGRCELGDCWRLWLTVGLLWLCQHQRFLQDPLWFAEDLVDDLMGSLEGSSLEGTAAWIRFTPANPDVWDPSRHSFAENYERLMSKWRAFLDEHAAAYLKDYQEILSACRTGAPLREQYR